MAGYNYRWNIEKQKENAEENLIKFIKKQITNYSPFYREWFKQHEIDVTKIKTISDVQKIPITTKAEHSSDPYSFILKPYMPEWWECKFETKPLSNYQSFIYWLKSQNKNYFREIFSKEPMKDEERTITEASNEWLPIHFHTTESAKDPRLIAYTKRDLKKNIPEIAAQIYSTGFRAYWEVFSLIPASPSINFFQSVWAPLSIGGGSFFTCGENITSIDIQIELANKITFEVFLGKPTYILKWLKTALVKLKKKEISPITSVKLCILSGEPLKPKNRTQIKQLFSQLGSQPIIIENYSNNRTKVSFTECSENSGIHLNPRYFYWEVLDRKTLEPVEDGESGYLCFSHIDWRGTVFLRYNTGDLIGGLEWKTCDSCGLTMPIIKGPITRKR